MIKNLRLTRVAVSLFNNPIKSIRCCNKLNKSGTLANVRSFVRFYNNEGNNSRTTTSKNMPSVIDLRSDTVTRPSAEMRKVMFEARVGDDVYKEDDTINQLEYVAAQLFGMEKALFVPTGNLKYTRDIEG